MSVRDPVRQLIHQAPFARLQAVTDALSSLVAYVDASQRHRFTNRFYERWFAQERGGLRGRPLREVWGEAAYAAVSPAVERALAGETVHLEMPLAFRHDEPRDVAVRFVPDVQRGEVCGFTVVIEDITERKRAEQALRDADRRKDEFLATLAHELRNPLSPIRNAVQVLQLAEADRAMTASARAMIERQLRQLVRLIDDLLDVSRIAQGRLELKRERIDLAQPLRLALEISRPLLETKQHNVQVIWPEEPLYVYGDPDRLAQVFANLLDNSAKYADGGGQITIAAMREGADAVVKVADNGVGIAPDLLPHVFDRFPAEHRGGAAAPDGLGIGLTLVRRLVELHGGAVEAASEGNGKGSTFTVRLAFAAADIESHRCSDAPRPRAERGRRASEGTRVLVVDDNHDAAASLALLLDLDGYDIRTASDGVEALAVADEFLPEFVLLDLGMPRLDGYETAREMRKRPWGRSARLLALTGWGQDEDKRRALEAGFDHHLTKPVDPGVLQRLMEERTS
jgi:PAS domain S-box-containing protein